MGKVFKKGMVLWIALILVSSFPLCNAFGKVIVDAQKGDQDLTIYGEQIFDGLGYPVFAADINGDGIKDIIVSATGSDGPGRSKINCGAIYVIFGKSTQPISLRFPDGADLTIYGAEHGINGIEGDEAGYVLASADLNHDGIDDLIIPAIFGDGPDNTRPDAGEVYIIYGRREFPRVMDLSVDADVIIYGANGGQGGDPENPDQGDLTGFALATGDLNHDGLKDIVISGVLGGGPQSDRPHSGTTYIVWGVEQLPPVIDLANSSNITTIWGAEAADYSGFALFVKDLNGDGIDDLMVGALGGDGPSNSRESCGEVYILYGKPSFPSTIDLATDADVIIYGARAGDQYFNPVNYISSGDVNGDGLPDLIIGASFSNGENGDKTDSGAVYIVYGRGSFPSVIDLATDADVVLYGIHAGDNAGFCIAVGDVNGDGKDDIVVGAPGGDALYDVRINSGEAYVIYGREDFPSVLSLSDADVVIYGSYPWDFLGVTVDCKDVNQDGVDDILIGAPFNDGFTQSTEDAGQAIVIFGGRGGIGLDAISPEDGGMISCNHVFKWTPGRPNNNIWVFLLFEAPDGSHLIHTSPFLLESTYTLPDNFLAEIPANKTLYWKVFGTNPNESPMRVQESQLFSLTREGLHLLFPGDSAVLNSPPVLQWSHGCSENDKWVAGISLDPNFSSFVAISPILYDPSWNIPDTIWQSLQIGVPLYWVVLGYSQPVPWRVLLDWAQEQWSFIKENPK